MHRSRVDIRTLQAEELDEAGSFITRHLGDKAQPETIPSLIAQIPAKYSAYPSFFVGAIGDGELLGLVIGWPEGGLTVRAVAVRPESRRMGLGSRLLRAFEEAARKQGFTSYALGAVWDAVPFYLANGMTCFANINLSDVDYGRLKELRGGYRIRGAHVFGSPPNTGVADKLSEVLGVNTTTVTAGFTGISLQVDPSEVSDGYAKKMKRDFAALGVQFGFTKTLTSSASP